MLRRAELLTAGEPLASEAKLLTALQAFQFAVLEREEVDTPLYETLENQPERRRAAEKPQIYYSGSTRVTALPPPAEAIKDGITTPRLSVIPRGPLQIEAVKLTTSIEFLTDETKGVGFMDVHEYVEVAKYDPLKGTLDAMGLFDDDAAEVVHELLDITRWMCRVGFFTHASRDLACLEVEEPMLSRKRAGMVQ